MARVLGLHKKPLRRRGLGADGEEYVIELGADGVSIRRRGAKTWTGPIAYDHLRILMKRELAKVPEAGDPNFGRKITGILKGRDKFLRRPPHSILGGLG